MKFLTLLPVLIGCCLQGFGQCPTYAISSTNANPRNGPQHSAYSKLTDKLYVCGNFLEESLSIGGLEVNALADEFAETTLFLMQFSKSGQVDWLKAVGQSYSVGYSGRLLPVDDGVIAVFRFSDTVFVDNQYTAYAEEQALLVKYNLNGDVVWSSHFESTGGTQAMGLSEDEEGNIYVAGMFTENVTVGNQSVEVTGNAQGLDGELFLAKFNASGEILWLRYLGGGAGIDFTTCMTYFSGRLFLAGFFSGELELGEDNFTATSNNNAFVTSTDSSGSVLWSQQLKSNRVRPSDVAIFNDQLTISGFFKESLVIQQTTINSSGNSDAVLLSFDVNGNLLKTKSFGGFDGDEIGNLTVISEELLGLGGHSQSEMFNVDELEFVNPDFNPGNDNSNMFYGVCDTGFVMQCFGYLESTLESRGFMEQISEDTILIVGSFGSDLPIGDTTLLTTGGSTFVVKTCMGCNELIKLDAPTIEKSVVQFVISPNPFTTQTQLNYHVPQGSRPTLQLTDMLGRVVQTVQLPGHEGSYTLQAAGLGTGVYFCSLVSGSEVLVTQKLSVMEK